MNQKFCQRVFLMTLIAVSVGCGNFMENLRRDAEDSNPVPENSGGSTNGLVGGSWSERGHLGDDNDLNTADKTLVGSSDSLSTKSWVASGDAEASRQNQYKILSTEPSEMPPVTSATTPVLEPDQKRIYKNGSRATRDDFVDQSQEEGSLWASSGQTNYYFTKNKIRSPGDIITLALENDLYRDVGAEIKKTLSPKERGTELEIAQLEIRDRLIAGSSVEKDKISTTSASPAKGLNSQSGAQPVSGPSPTPLASPTKQSMAPEEAEKIMPKATLADINILPALDLKVGDKMMGEIVERFPNGNYKIRTLKKVIYKRGPPRLVSLVGIVKGTDISEDTDTVNSGRIYEYRIEIGH